MVDLSDNKFLERITLAALKNGYPVLYPPPLIWDRINSTIIKRSWERVRGCVRKDPESNKICLYIHIPYCDSRCIYCNCTSYSRNNSIPLKNYLVALKTEIDSLSILTRGIKFSSLYIGGGTPTLLTNHQLKDLILYIKQNFLFGGATVFALDAHPNSLDLDKLNLLKKLGLTRLTIGVESLDKNVLRMSARKQTPDAVYQAVSLARTVGIPYLNIDLMAGLPGQTLKSFSRSLLKVISLNPDIIHINPFIPDDQTLFSEKGRRLTHDDIIKRARMIKLKNKTMKNFGQFKNIGRAPSTQTEAAINQQINLFESPEFKTSILGLGYGAISYAFGNLCYKHTGTLKDYCDRRGLFNGYPMTDDEEMRFYAIKFIRQGLNKNLFKKLFGKDFGLIFKTEVSCLKTHTACQDNNDLIRPFFKNKKEFYLFSKVFYSKKALALLEKQCFNRREDKLKKINIDAYLDET